MSAAPVLTAQAKIKLAIASGQEQGRELVYSQERITIGRGTDNDVSFANDSKMSRQHAEVLLEGNKLRIRNLSKKNYILINGQQLEEAVLDKNMVVKLGDTELNIFLELPGVAKPIMASVELQNPIVPLPSEPAPVPTANAIQKLSPSKNNFLATSPAMNAAPVQYAPPPPPPQAPRAQQAEFTNRKPAAGNRVRFYAIVMVVVVALGYFFLSDSPKSKKKLELRRSEDIAKSIQESVTTVKEIETTSEKRGEQSYQYKVAQEHYIRGFRDYQKGQYGRAIQSFQASRSLYPQHELAIKYEKLAKLKFDEIVQFNMNQGKRYAQKNNYRLCKSSFFQVMTMLKDSSNIIYREAKQLYDECSLKMEAKY